MVIDILDSSYTENNGYKKEDCRKWAIIVNAENYHTAILVPEECTMNEVNALAKNWVTTTHLVKLEDCSKDLCSHYWDLWNSPDDMHSWYMEDEEDEQLELARKDQLIKELYVLFGKDHPIHDTYEDGTDEKELLLFHADFQSYFMWKV